MRVFHRALLKLVLRVVHHPKLTLLIALAILVACVVLALTRLTISTDQNQLFSDKVPFFRNYLDFVARFRETEAIYVVLEPLDGASPPIDRWTEAADAIAARLSARTDLVEHIESHVSPQELGDRALLYDSPAQLPADFHRLAQFLPLAEFWAEPAFTERLLGRTPIERFIAGVGTRPADAPTAQFVNLLAQSWLLDIQSPASAPVPDLRTLGAADPLALGYAYVRDQSITSGPPRYLLLVSVYPRRKFNSLTANSATVATIRQDCAAVHEQFPEFRFGVSGRPALEADEMQTTQHDSHQAETCAVVTIFICLVVMLRSFWLALVAEIALAVGVGWTFGWATLTLGQLNLLSIVFLIALIGIGMDYLVQILTRYRQEASRSNRASSIWVQVFHHVAPPINTACAGAAGAFFVAVFTDFRGAAELGIIAGAGLFLCLAAGYTVLPALLVLFPVWQAPINYAARRAERAPRPAAARRRMIYPFIWMAALLLAGTRISDTSFNANLLSLQAQNLESVQLIAKLQTWSAVVISRDLDMLGRVRQAVRPAPTVSSTSSYLDAIDNYQWLQSQRGTIPAIHWQPTTALTGDDLTAIAGKSRALADKIAGPATNAVSTMPAPDAHLVEAAATLRRFADALDRSTDRNAVAGRLGQWQQSFVDELREICNTLTPPPPSVDAMPDVLRRHFVSADGYYALYITPTPTLDLWQRPDLEKFESDVESRVAAIPGAPPVTGIASDIYHSTSYIQSSFYRSAAAALALIFVLVLIDLRRIDQTLIAVSVLALGLPMLLGLMGFFHVDWNFANFFGLPILIGAGHEYGVFMVHRYREALNNERRAWNRWDASDRALLLCAFITTSSFGFFWALGHHRGLRSLGLVMAMGTACIYLATILVVRPLLMWKLQRADEHRGKAAGAASA